MNTLLHEQVPPHWLRIMADGIGWTSNAAAVAARHARIDLRTLRSGLLRSVSYEQELVFLDTAAKALADPCLGLKLGLTSDPATQRPISYMLLTPRTLGAAAAALLRYLRMIRPNALTAMEPAGSSAVLVLDSRIRELRENRQHMEFALAAIVTVLRASVSGHLMPDRVEFAHAPSNRHTMIEEALGCPVVFGRARPCIILRRRDLELPTTAVDPLMLSLLLERGEALQKMGRTRRSVRRALEHALLLRLSEGTPMLSQVAAELGLSARTLSRRLASEGATYTEVLEELRSTMATAYLTHTDLSLGEIAFLLGYAEQSSFSTAYRRWTGRAPSGVRLNRG